MRKHTLIGIAVATFFIYFIKETGENSVTPLFFILIFLTVSILFIILIINIFFIISFFITPISHTLQFRGLDTCSRRCIGTCLPDRHRMDDFSHCALE